MKSFNFGVVSTGKRLSNIDNRPAFRVLSANNRMKVTDELKRLVGIADHVSYGVAPISDEDGVYIGVFPAVGVEGDEGVEYPQSSKISKTNEFTDANIATTLRKLVIDQMTDAEKEEAKNQHFVFLPLLDEDGEMVWVDGEAYGEPVKTLVLTYAEAEEKQRGE